MDPQLKELGVLVRHVPRIVVSHFIHHPERLREPTSSSFMAVVALFDISGFSSLGSKLSDDERDKTVKGSNIHNNNNLEEEDEEEEEGPTSKHQDDPAITSGASSGGSGWGKMAQLLHDPSRKHTQSPQLGSTHSLRGHSNTSGRLDHASPEQGSTNNDPPRTANRLDALTRDLMRQRRENSHSTTSGLRSVARGVSFVSRAKPAAPQGIAVETLTTTLNKTLEPVIDVILKHGGDIIKFAGDALIVIWETEGSHPNHEETPPGLLVYNAVKCALEALRVLNATSLRHGHTSILGMHVGIGVSRVTGNHVGGVLDRWEFYLSGDANRQMALAEAEAGKGEVALSREAFNALSSIREQTGVQFDVDETPFGNFLVHALSRPQVPIKPLPIPTLKPTLELIPFLRGYVPGTISSYLRKGLAINPTSRNITVVFIKLEGVTELESEQEQQQYIQKSLSLIQESAYKVQGTLRQFVIDDKGAVAIVVIGLPPFYHENNALRGVKLSCHLLDKGLQAAIGVTTGTAYCGSIGTNARAEYAVVGDVINLSARLMSAAGPGDIFCDEVTTNDSRDSIQYQDATEITVKGKTTKVRVFRVQRVVQTKTKLDPTSLADASHALPYGSERIVDMVPLFGSGAHRPDRRGQQHRVLIIAGETGTGKSMLLRHFQHNHTRSFMGSGDPVDTSMEFHAWSGIIREMISRTIKVSKQRKSIGENEVRSANPTDSEQHMMKRSSRTDSKSDDRMMSMILASGYNNDQDPSHGLYKPVHEGSSNSVVSKLLPSTDDTNLSYERIPVIDYLIRNHRISEDMVPILNDILPYDQLFQGTLDTLERGEERTLVLESLLFSVIELVSSQKPILLMFDNAQWIDAHSWSLLIKVLEELPQVYVLIATRLQSKVKRQPLFEVLQSLPYVKQQDIIPFNNQETSLFLCQHYHIAIMDTQVLEFVFTRTDGNPCELIKLMDFMIQSKYITIHRENGNITILSDLDDLDMQVPQYTRAKVMSSVDALDGVSQMALKVISIHPEPVEEKMLYGILTLCLNSEREGSDEMTGGTRHKIPLTTSANAIHQQVQNGLAECERDAIITMDQQNKLLFFNSEEMRLVVYDTMLPSQREMIHLYFCQWFKDITKHNKTGNGLATTTRTGSMMLEGSVTATATEASSSAPTVVNTNPSSPKTGSTMNRIHQQYAMLGYHLARSNKTKTSLEAYQKAAESALEAKDLAFATDCMQSSYRILDDASCLRNINELDYILLRSKIEFLHGAIAIEKSEWDTAITHMSYIMRLCQRKHSVLRRYSSSVLHHDPAIHQQRHPINNDGSMIRKCSAVSEAPSVGPSHISLPSQSSERKIPLGESLRYTEMRQTCMPKLFNFQRLIPWGYPASLFMSLKRNHGNGRLVSRNSFNWNATTRVQPEQTILALNQVNFYKKKAEILIKKIIISKQKQEEMSREIQRLTQKSLKTKTKK